MDEIADVIRSVPLPDLSAVPMRINDLLSAMQKDKKAKEGRIRVVLPQSIGKASLPVPVSRASLRKALKFLKTYAS
jgi:3-dehydroquinate synthetase